MRVLAFDTATELLSLAYLDGNRRYLKTIDGDLRHAENLFPEMLTLLEGALRGTEAIGQRESSAGTTSEDAALRLAAGVELVVCTRGPGSFTGLRIGMSSAKGLAAGSGCALVSVPTLHAYAWHARFFDGAVIPAIDARKNRFYCRIYNSSSPAESDGTADLDGEVDLILERTRAERRLLVTGPDGEALFRQLLERKGSGGPQILLDPSHRSGCGDALLALGIESYLAGRVDGEDQGPVYIRDSDARVSFASRPDAHS
ncbi:tRNA (adenosine(37)-N6)-threonylcarbamoyltransferase complex dimerization subunit type 1 TsaB [Salinispira pacifica]